MRSFWGGLLGGLVVIGLVACGEPGTVATATPGVPTRVIYPTVPPTPTIDPTVMAIYNGRQATAAAYRQEGCDKISAEYAKYGRTFNTTQDPELTVIELARLEGIDPTIHSAYGDFLTGYIRNYARQCQGR